MCVEAGLSAEPSGKGIVRWKRDRGNIAVVLKLCSAKF